MLINFVVLFTLFYLLAAMIDIIVNLDEFDKSAALLAKDSGPLSRLIALFKVVISFEGPRLFQVFAYLHGVIAIGAMAFTAATMFKSNEFVAMMAAGISLRKVAAPFVVVTAFISVLALANQEFMLPRVAPLLLRGHHESSKQTAGDFQVPFTPDKSGSLLIAKSFNTLSGKLHGLSFLERDEKGRMVKQIQASTATWDMASNAGWHLVDGRAVDIYFDEDTSQATISSPIQVEFYETELSPYVLTLHRYGQFVGMLGMTQLNSMINTVGVFDIPMLRRHWYSRFASIALNLLTLLIVIPLFVTRVPIVLSRQAVVCGSISITILFGGIMFMLMPIAGFPAIASVFLPALLLLPVALLRTVGIRT